MVAIFLLVVTCLTMGSAQARKAGEGEGTLQRFTYSSPWGDNPCLVYTPGNYYQSMHRPAPVVVMVHGCNTTAMEQARASAWQALAERERFVVVYPDNTGSWPWGR